MTEESNLLERNKKLVITTIVLVCVVSVVAGGIYFMNQSSESTSGEDGSTPEKESSYSTFIDENYGLSFSYPSSWTIDNRVYLDVLIITVYENSTSGSPDAQTRIYAGHLGYPSLDNLEKRFNKSVENNENLNSTGEIERINVQGTPGIDVSYKSLGENYDLNARTRILKKENFEYLISYSAMENSYEELQPDLDSIIENFAVL